MLKLANLLYRNSQPIMTDNEYDYFTRLHNRKMPIESGVFKIGAPVEKNKAQLPYEMASMDKIKPDTGHLTNWTKNTQDLTYYRVNWMESRGLYSTESTTKLYTRGDGKVGQDISRCNTTFNAQNTNVVIRGEFIIPRAYLKPNIKQNSRIHEIWCLVL